MPWKLPLSVLLLAVCGCMRNQANQVDPYRTLGHDPSRDAEAAVVRNAKAVELMRDGNLELAEKQLNEALQADLLCGPAHNNLGVVHFRQQRFYLAAWEFQYAAKLMPGKAEPRNNLGMVFEAVGKLGDAAKWYEEAHKLEPETVEVIGNLARILVRTNRGDHRTRELLEEVVLRDQRPDWVTWARERLALMGDATPAASTATPTR